LAPKFPLRGTLALIKEGRYSKECKINISTRLEVCQQGKKKNKTPPRHKKVEEGDVQKRLKPNKMDTDTQAAPCIVPIKKHPKTSTKLLAE